MYMDCPSCGIKIEIEAINCGIFRCGRYKDTGEQVPPHLPKEQCEELIREDKIWGCCQAIRYDQGRVQVGEYV